MFNNKANGNGSASAETSKKPSASSAPRAVSNSAPSILGRDLSITGDIKTDGDIQIDGRLEGNIVAGNVTVGEQGSVNGKIKAASVNIRGKVTGKVDAVSVELSETANVQADLNQDQLMIANGAFFDGKCTRKSSAPTSLKTAAMKKKSA